MPQDARLVGLVPRTTATSPSWPTIVRAALVGSVSIVLAALPVLAESAATPDTSDDDSAQTFLDELTVTATRTEREVGDIPGQVDVVGADEIEERGYTHIDDLVRYLPGVEVDGDPSRLGSSGFVIRGIGGNRVLTEIDGVPTAEQFDFGPFSIHQFALDVDALESVEIVRSAGSALYGSDALGGVVSLTTRDPRSYLGSDTSYVGLRGGWDGRSDEASASTTLAFGGDRVQGSLLYTQRDGQELDNQGTVDTQNFTRTTPNPIDRRQSNALLQLSITPNDSNAWRIAGEVYDTEAETEVLSARNPGSPFASAVLDSDGHDTQERARLSVTHTSVGGYRLFDTSLVRAFYQDTNTRQETVELRAPSVGTARRDGLLTFDQENAGLDLEFNKAIGSGGVLTFGAAYQRDSFDQLRDRSEVVLATGLPVPTTLAFPSKYFPQSTVTELGVFAQAEIELLDGRLSLVPGVRFDRYQLDADENDTIFLAGNPGTPTPVDLDEDSVSPKLGAVLDLTDGVSVFAQYARGFRAPPMSSVNNGFTNLGGGYRTLPNPDLLPETSDNVELGLRIAKGWGSFSIAGFVNRYDDFIETVFLGFNPSVFLVEFQPQNVEDVEISGIELMAEWRIDRRWSVRASFTDTEGTDEIADEPLESIAPSQLVLGLRYRAPNGRWGAELIGTATASKDASDLPSDSTQFQVPSQEVVDLAAWLALTDRFDLQLSIWNLGDETAWPWQWVRGQTDDSPTLDRFTSPGRSAGLQVRYVF